MRVYVCSDLHVEFHPDGGAELIGCRLPEADLILVAGDLANARLLPEALKLLARRYPQVVYVAGNHEYYGSNREEVALLREGLPGNIAWLENEVIELNGLCIAGCTMWFGPQPLEARCLVNDFYRIGGLGDWYVEANRRSLEFLDQVVTSNTMVMTHHAPSIQSVDPLYRHKQSTGFFVCPEAEMLIARCQPPLWIHGHTHRSADYMIGGTRIYCNPYGYHHREMNSLFQWQEGVFDWQELI